MTNAPIDILRIRINYFSHCPDHYPRQWLSFILMLVNIPNIRQRCGTERRFHFVRGYFMPVCLMHQDLPDIRGMYSTVFVCGKENQVEIVNI